MSKRDKIIIVCVIVFLVIDIAVRLSHPAYRSYRTLAKELEIRDDDFHRRLVLNFFPVITNELIRVYGINNSSNHVEEVATNDLVNVVDVSSNRVEDVGESCRIGYICGKPYLRYRDRTYQEGDLFYRDRITSIGVDNFVVGDVVYRVGFPVPATKEEIISNEQL